MQYLLFLQFYSFHPLGEWVKSVLRLNLDCYRSFSVVAKLATNFLNWSPIRKVWSPWHLKWSQLGWLSELFCDVYNILGDTSAPRHN